MNQIIEPVYLSFAHNALEDAKAQGKMLAAMFVDLREVAQI